MHSKHDLNMARLLGETQCMRERGRRETVAGANRHGRTTDHAADSGQTGLADSGRLVRQAVSQGRPPDRQAG